MPPPNNDMLLFVKAERRLKDESTFWDTASGKCNEVFHSKHADPCIYPALPLSVYKYTVRTSTNKEYIRLYTCGFVIYGGDLSGIHI